MHRPNSNTPLRLLALIACAALGSLLALGSISPAAAAPAVATTSQGPAQTTQEQGFDPATIETGFVAFSKKWATPLAVIGIIMALLAFLVVPVLPEWAAGMKGYIVRALLIIAVIALVPSIVRGVATIGGNGSDESDQLLLVLTYPLLVAAERGYTRWSGWYRRAVGARE